MSDRQLTECNALLVQKTMNVHSSPPSWIHLCLVTNQKFRTGLRQSCWNSMLKRSHSICLLSYLPNSVLFIVTEKVTYNLNFTYVAECVPVHIL